MGCATIIKTSVEREEMHMARIKRGAAVASILMLTAVVVSACKTPYSTPPAATITPIGTNSLFETPLTPDITMSDVANFGTSTALASSGTPQAIATQTLSVSTQDLSASATQTVEGTVQGTINPALTSTTATLALPTSAPVGTRPTEWTLHKGEFPYCIARRFDVDPEALLSLNGLASGNIFYANRTLKIPQTGSFPGTRALRAHTPTYRVGSSSETVYSIACFFGDVRPEDIVRVNNLASADVVLTTGQELTIP
jgi:LysM repeat protein